MMLQKNEIGITLVALVVTIIILLILAGISIATLTGSGLFEKAILSEQKSKEAQEKENTILSDYENEIEKNLNKNESKEDKDYNKLLSIANINTSKTLQEVLEDEELLEVIFNNEQAVEYIKSNEDVLLPAIYDSEKALEKLSEKAEKSAYLTDNNRIKNSSYHPSEGYCAHDGSTSTAWRPTYGEAIANSYLTYDNLQNKKCFRIDITWDYTVKDGVEFQYIFQGSTDNENWEEITEEQLHKNAGMYTIYTTNKTPYRYFRYKGVSGSMMHSAGKYSARIVELRYYFI